MMKKLFRPRQHGPVYNQRCPCGWIYRPSMSQTEELDIERHLRNLRSINIEASLRSPHFNKRSEDLSDCALPSDKPGDHDPRSLNYVESDTKGDRLDDLGDNGKTTQKIRPSQQETYEESEILQQMMLDDLLNPGDELESLHLWDPVLKRLRTPSDNQCRPEINADKIRRDSLGSGQSPDEVTTAEAEIFRRMMYDGLLELDEELDISDLLEPEYHRNLKKMQVTDPDFPCAPALLDECLVCFQRKKSRRRLCCDFPVCDECMGKYLEFKVESGVVKIKCVSGTCDSFIHRDEIVGRLPLATKDKFYRFLIDANKDPDIKTCPQCSNIYNRLENGMVQNYGKYGVKVECPDCKLDWCFECQAPWHANIKCKDFRKGDKLLKSWAKEHQFGQQNAQRCPKCKRTSGCDHMSCSNCNTDFCYQCGDRYIDLSFFGSHNSRLSPLGCKYNYKPTEPVKRKLVRGSLLGAKVLGGVFLMGLGLAAGAAAGAILIGASPIILPVIGGIKCRRQLKECRDQAERRYREECIPT